MNLRLSWVQPEDLIGHELRQAAEDGRDAADIARRWHAAGGPPAPSSAGASPVPADPGLRELAGRLLDELAALADPSAAREPTPLERIREACPDWPRPGSGPSPGTAPSHGAPGGSHGRSPGGRAAPPSAAEGHLADDTSSRGPAGDHTAAADNGHAGLPARYAEGSRRAGTVMDTGKGTSTGTARRAGTGAGTGAEERAGAGTDTQRGARDESGTGTRAGAGQNVAAASGRQPADDPLLDRLHAAWLGRAAGCLLGKPVEKLPLHAIRGLARAAGNWPLADWFTAKGVPAALLRAHPWNRRSAATSLAENIDGMPEDDDLNYPLLTLLLLQRYGTAFRTSDVAQLWLDELPAGRTFTAERLAYRNLLAGLEPPLTATRRNPFREWIGAAIRADVHGWTHPGDPAAAARQAHRDAVLTHTANGVYAAMFIAAALAEAAGGTADVHQCLRTGLRVVPPESRLADAVTTGIATAAAHTDFDTVVDRLHAVYGSYHWVHCLPNAALLSAALTHADGDFSGSICRAVSGGWDTDSNGATAGSLAGLLAGHPDRLPERWTAPLKNRLASSVGTFDGIGFDALARLTHANVTLPEDPRP